jgi:sodium transport system permease protein
VRLRDVGIVFRKEILDITRDRRTLVFMVLLPIAIVPGLTLLFGRVTRAGIQRLQETPSKVAIAGAAHAPPSMIELFRSMKDLKTLQQHLLERAASPDPFLAGLLLPPEEPLEGAALPDSPEAFERAMEVRILEVVSFDAGENPHEDPEALARIRGAIEGGELDAVLVFHPGFAGAIDAGQGALYTMIVSEGEERSKMAGRKVERFMRLGARGVPRARLDRGGVPAEALTPIRGSTVNVGREENLLARLLPYLIVLMCFSGAMMPANDLAAGEKERGTLETLLVSPAGRLELVLGKLLVVVTAALVAAVLSVVGLSASLALGFTDVPGLSMRFDAMAAALSVLLMLPTAMLFAALLLSLSIFARSFREAQTYAVPLNFLVLVPAILSLVPGFDLTPGVALVPVLNVSMALKEAWVGTVRPGAMALIFASTAVYAGLAVAFCAWWFRREAVLFRG